MKCCVYGYLIIMQRMFADEEERRTRIHGNWIINIWWIFTLNSFGIPMTRWSGHVNIIWVIRISGGIWMEKKSWVTKCWPSFVGSPLLDISILSDMKSVLPVATSTQLVILSFFVLKRKKEFSKFSDSSIRVFNTRLTSHEFFGWGCVTCLDVKENVSKIRSFLLKAMMMKMTMIGVPSLRSLHLILISWRCSHLLLEVWICHFDSFGGGILPSFFLLRLLTSCHDHEEDD